MKADTTAQEGAKMSKLVLFSGNASKELTAAIAKYLNIPVGRATVGKFSDGEITTEIHENVRGKDVFIIQSTCNPANDNLMEIMVMADALRRSSAARITAVIPYFGYARQDRRVRSARVPITARVVADMLTAVGIHRVLTVDLHADQIQGFFDIPVDNVYSTSIFQRDIESKNYEDIVVVSPDIGGVVRARAAAKMLGDDIELAIIDKRRPKPNESQVMHLIGDVQDRTCIIIDDIVDTAGTMCKAAEALKEFGAKKVLAYCTHAVLSGKAIENINNSVLDELVATDSIGIEDKMKKCSKIRTLSLSKMLAESIRRTSNEESLSAMFEPDSETFGV